MTATKKNSAVTAVLTAGLILFLGNVGDARQGINPGQAVQTTVQAGMPNEATVLVSHNNATLTWVAVKDDRVVGYYVYKGTSPSAMSKTNVGMTTSYYFNNLAQGNTWYFAVSSYDKKKNESPLSPIVSKVIPKVKGG